MVAVQWYPGHMEKARRQMQENLKSVDIIIELRDARIPYSSANPMLEQMAGNKPRLILLSKSDLADPAETEKWILYLSQENRIVISCDILNDKSIRSQVLSACKTLWKEKREKMVRRGIHPRPARAMVIGIPNAGKSTLINAIAKRKSAKTEDRPGVTRSLTWIHADKELDILDTPGVLWPKFSDSHTGSLLAATGAINEDILDLKEIALDTIHVIREYYPGLLEEKYHAENDIKTDAMLDRIAKTRHLLKENNEPDIDRAANVFLHELRRGKLGRITLERCNEKNKDLPQ